MVSLENIENIVKKIKVSLDDSMFFSRLHSYLSKLKKRENKDKLYLLVTNEYSDISKYLEYTEIQEPCSVRNHIRCCRLAQVLIDKEGHFNKSVLDLVILILEQNLYFLGPGRHYDANRQRHILNVLYTLKNNKEAFAVFNRINKPVAHKYAEDLIRATLRLPKNMAITDAHTRQAVLSAWLSYIRQNVGSCFATAPAIIIQREQPLSFLKDIEQLFNTGRLKRTFAGIEYTVPLSASWGVADLKRPFVVNREDICLEHAPGLVSAFEAAGIVERTDSFESKTATIRKLLVDCFQTFYSGQLLFITTAESLIKQVLLITNNITDDDIEKKGEKMVHTSLMMEMVKENNKHDSYNNFYRQYDQAKQAFKSLTDNAILKAWEFSIASFAETKAQISHWNFYASLGLNPEEDNGIGKCIYEIIQRKLEHYNRLTSEYHQLYEQKFVEVQHAEIRLNNAISDQDIYWLKAEYQNRIGEMNELLFQRDASHEKAKRFVNMYQFIMWQYENKFKDYFQEVYDADMHDVQTSIYDDSPAGFRLLYKHGRSNTSLWEMIYEPEKFIEFLVDFFNSTERELMYAKELEGLEEDFSQCVRAVINLIRTKEFLEASLYRMAIIHNTSIPKNPLKNMDKISKKPWVHISGGTMESLVNCYYCQEKKLSVETFKAESEIELLAFLINTMKSLPEDIHSLLDNENDKSLLMHSPTHAFLLKPNMRPFKDAWSSNGDTYSWIQNNVITPAKNLVNEIWLTDYEIDILINHLSKKIDPFFRQKFIEACMRIPGEMTTTDFRDFIVNTMKSNKALQFRGRFILNLEEVDSTLYELLPFSSSNVIKETLDKVFDFLYKKFNYDEVKNVYDIYPKLENTIHQNRIISAKLLREICLSLLMFSYGKTTAPIDYYKHVTEAMRNAKLAMPKPVIFADTNWPKDYFGFVFNPGSSRLELWRVDYVGSTGVAMSEWAKWLNGSYKEERSWGIYVSPREYT